MAGGLLSPTASSKGKARPKARPLDSPRSPRATGLTPRPDASTAWPPMAASSAAPPPPVVVQAVPSDAGHSHSHSAPSTPLLRTSMIGGAGAPTMPSTYIEYKPPSSTASARGDGGAAAEPPPPPRGANNAAAAAAAAAYPTTAESFSYYPATPDNMYSRRSEEIGDHQQYDMEDVDTDYMPQQPFAGINSRELSSRQASTQFIDFLVPRGSGGAIAKAHKGVSHIKPLMEDDRRKKSLVVVDFNYPNALVGAGGYPSRGAAAGSASSSQQLREQVDLYAGLTSNFIAEQVARTRLERRLQNPDYQPVKKAYARRASTANEAAHVIYRLPTPRDSGFDKVERKARLSLCLAPKVAELLYNAPGGLTETLLKQTKRPSVAEIRMLTPQLFDGAAGLNSTQLTMVGPSRSDMLLHDSIALGKQFASPGHGDDDAPPPKRRMSHDMRRGSEIAKLLGTLVPDGIAQQESAIASSAPQSMFDNAAGMRSRELSKDQTGFHWDRPSREKTFGDEAKFAMYGGGPKLVGTVGSLAEQKKMARRASIIRTADPAQVSAFEGAAGASSKQMFFTSDWMKTPHGASHFFSENLQFKPVGVVGLGTDAKQKRVEDAAGKASDELFAKSYEALGLMPDETKPMSAALAFDHQISDGVIYYGGSASRFNGIPDANPAPFVGAAGLSSAHHAMMLSRLSDAEIMAEELNVSHAKKLTDEPTTAEGRRKAIEEDHLTPRRKQHLRRMSESHKAQKGGYELPEQEAVAAKLHPRRGSMYNTEGVALFGGPMLQRVRGGARDRSPGGGRGDPGWLNLPKTFEGAAGLSSQQKNRPSFLPGSAAEAEAAAAEAEANAAAASRPSSPSTNARRGSALHSESFAILGGEALSELRAKRVGANDFSEIARRPKSAPAWAGMPAAFEGGAGLPSKLLQLIETRSMPDARVTHEEGPPPPRERDYTRPPSPRSSSAFEGAAGLTSDEEAKRKSMINFVGHQRPVVGGFEAGDVIKGVAKDGSSKEDDQVQQEGEGEGGARIYEIPEAYPQAYVGAAGLTSSESAVARGRGLGFEKPAGASRPPLEELDQQSFLMAAAEMLDGLPRSPSPYFADSPKQPPQPVVSPHANGTPGYQRPRSPRPASPRAPRPESPHSPLASPRRGASPPPSPRQTFEMLASTPVGLLHEAQQRRPSPRPSSREASPRRDSFHPIDPRRDSLAATSGGGQQPVVQPLFEKGGFKGGGGGSGAGSPRQQDSPRADSSRSYLNNYWDSFASNHGQRQVAIG